MTDSSARSADPVVDMRGITVEFPGVRALSDVDFQLFPGEVHALMGENGAGKSTLIKALTGVHRPTSGEIRLHGEPVEFTAPVRAQNAGISTVYQEVNLCPNLSVAENILLGREPRRLGAIDVRACRTRAARLLDRIGLSIDPGSALGSHPIAVQQLVAIARALAVDARVLVLDEPTSSLDTDEVAELFRIMRVLRDEGVAILFVSHFLEQVYEIADRMTVLRNGALVGEYLPDRTGRLELVSVMLGRELGTLEEVERRSGGRDPGTAPVLTARGLGRAGAIAPFDLEIHAGEVVGLAGLLGSGRTEMVRLLFGADRASTGTLGVDGRTVRPRGPRSMIARGVALCSEDRKAEGVVADLTVRDNLTLALQAARGWMRPVPRRVADALVNEYIEKLDIRPADPGALMSALSGGNQQKVLLARWLITRPRLLILDEPTRGIDVGAKVQIQKVVADLAAEGMAVLFVSAELEEVVRVSDRVVVLRDRRKVTELAGDGVTVDKVMSAIAAHGDQDSAVAS
ncbi:MULTISPECIES: sugar ABC transporter ATP-binding protein [Nocardiopsis]|uniref:Simple sugar transport system ATP-binding protein n=1 Tax=Nocardiopsis sinuspersici TaxID=501010 RepID=A0A1V3BZZ7_9ACTN|nr:MULTISPECIES: sugar ABC transporter ATP-binding protein [Nocardiopsis]NYH55500.1 simple sugar transport system ATP-binding protein [Nocardiopsis sinuspersici]OOC54124.1 sugar ABC transporter ATP-binding protein [Nocardiopsis sinuspersici]